MGNSNRHPADQVHPLASALALFARGISGVQVRWLDSEPARTQCIYFANHTSHLDAVVLWAALPGELRACTRPVAAKDYWGRTAWLRYLSTRVFGAVLIDRHRSGSDGLKRSAGDVIERLARSLGDRHSLIVFPEGTRGEGGDVAPFRSGLYHLALRRPEVDLVPAWLENLNRILPKGEVLPVPLLSVLTFGPPLRVAPGEGKIEFLARARESVRRLRQI